MRDRVDLGRVGLWTMDFERCPAGQVQEAAAAIEEMGIPTLWIPEAVGRDAFVASALLLEATDSLTVATGIANMWSRGPHAAFAAMNTLAEWHPGRFVLGLGVSHHQLVEGVRAEKYDKPLTRMRNYVESMESAGYLSYPPTVEPSVVLAALGPRMLALAAEKTMGAHPYHVTTEHTARAREIMGDGAFLAPELGVVFDTDPESARATARAAVGPYMFFPNYRNNWKRLGFSEDDFEGGGSDRFIDAVVAWGDDDAVAAGIKAHLDAGADHVAVQVFHGDLQNLPMDAWRRVAAIGDGLSQRL